MSVKIRTYQGQEGVWEVDVRVLLPDGTLKRERRKAPVSGKAAAKKWGERRERFLANQGSAVRPTQPKGVPSLSEFWPRFLEQHAGANRDKPSSVAAKETIGRVHLIPVLGAKPLDQITTKDVQALKAALARKAPKTVNNILTVLHTLLKTAVEWDVIGGVPCVIKLLKTPETVMSFHGFEEFDRLVAAAAAEGHTSSLVTLLGGEAGLRCGEIIALEWADVDLAKPQVRVARSEWKGQVTTPKGGRVRHVGLTARLVAALQQSKAYGTTRVVRNRKGESLTQKEVQVVMRRVARRANVKKGVHILRHTFCSHLAMRGAAPTAIQALAGHRDLATTQRYMHLSPATLDAAMRLLDRSGSAQLVGDMMEAAGTDTKNPCVCRAEMVEAAGVEP